MKTRTQVSAILFDHAESKGLGDENGVYGFPRLGYSI